MLSCVFVLTGPKVYKGYVTVFSRSASKRQATIKKELFETKQEMNLTSAQDEFAKWARLRCKVDKLTQDLDVQSGFADADHDKLTAQTRPWPARSSASRWCSRPLCSS